MCMVDGPLLVKGRDWPNDCCSAFQKTEICISSNVNSEESGLRFKTKKGECRTRDAAEEISEDEDITS